MNLNKVAEKKKKNWKTIRSFFSNENVSSEPITLADDDNDLTDKQKLHTP